MKKPTITMLVFVVCYSLTSCNLLSDVFWGHSKKGLTSGAISLLNSYNELLTKKYVCYKDPSQFIWGVNSTMPSNQYLDHPAQIDNKLVSYGTRFFSVRPDQINNEWDYLQSNFNNFPPIPLIWPYGNCPICTNDVYVLKFVPVDTFKKLNPDPVWNEKNLIPGVTLTEVKTIKDYYLEKNGGFISKSYSKLYNNQYSALGIICDIELKSHELVKCYMITYELSSDDPSHFVLWKKKS